MKITNEILEAYLNCKTKGHLKLVGETGTKSDYEAMTEAASRASRELSLAGIIARYGKGNAYRGTAITAAMLKQGAPLLADAILEDDGMSIRFDALMRADGPSKLGGHHYVPVLHNHGDKVGHQPKLLLAILGLVLDGVQGLRPATGLVARGREGRLGKVRLDARLYRQAEQVLDEAKQLLAGGDLPHLTLNKHCQICEFRQLCRKQAEETDNISLLGGVGEKELRRFHRRGIFTLTQLSCTFHPRKKHKGAVQRTTRHHALQAMAIRDKRIYIFGTPELPKSPVRIFLDVEGVPEEGFIYLIGLVVCKDGEEKRLSFWADGKEQEAEIFQQFLDEVTSHEDFKVFCYGAYERNFIKRMRKTASRTEQVDRVLNSLINLLAVVYDHIYFPCHSNGLKDVAGSLGCFWTEPDASGVQSLVWRARWETTQAGEWKRKLLVYNAEDCDALKRVADALYDACSRADRPGDCATTSTAHLPFSRLGDIDKPNETCYWGRTQFVHEDFNFVNKFSHFDYQRDRVYARVNRKIKKRHPGKHRNRKLPVNKYLEMAPQACPACACEELSPVPSDNRTRKLYTKRSFDLVIRAGGIRRRVIECHGGVYQCSHCSHRFLPPDYEKLDKHGHGLKSWAMSGHVQHGFSLSALQSLLTESFGLHVHAAEIHMFKSLLAHQYRPTYEALLKKITTGAVLHADETEVILKLGKGYVWVFAGIAEVVFMYRPTRDGDFLRPLLKDFHGVLISDFYAAYDGIDCPQQKCLIHLMRDMNRDLLANPYDLELRSLTGSFGTLLKEVVCTIDLHGLKRRFLMRHDKAVAEFFESFASQSFRSEVAEALRQRLLRYRDKLFAFIEHDGVSWNNNLAEYAIKRFACYRKGTVGSLNEEGIADYLTLLSIAHTCRIRGVSFLRFLLSRELDLDSFSTRRGIRRFRPEVETYPVGFMPPRLAGLEKLRTRSKKGDGGT